MIRSSIVSIERRAMISKRLLPSFPKELWADARTDGRAIGWTGDRRDGRSDGRTIGWTDGREMVSATVGIVLLLDTTPLLLRRE